MHNISSITIKSKLILIIMLTTGVSLLLACTTMVIMEMRTFKQELVDDLSIQADIVASSSSAAVVFNDPKVASEAVSALRVKPNIVAAHIYKANGSLFVEYERGKGNEKILPSTSPQEGYQFSGGNIVIFRKIILDGEMIGTIGIQASTQEIRYRLWSFIGIISIVILVSLLAAFLLSSKVQSLISEPIQKLANAAIYITDEKDYSVRVQSCNCDELGDLIDGFNGMLEQIELRDADLLEASSQLERRVEERTNELQQEIIDRMKAEEALRESENRFRKLVENAMFGMAVHDIVFDENGTPVNYVFLQVNPAFELQTGLCIADVQGKQITDAIPGIEDAPFLDIYSRVALTGEPIVFEHYIEPLHRHFNISAYQVDYGRFATVFDDITERKQSEETLRDSEMTIRSITESAQDAILMMNSQGLIEFWNPAAERIFGYSADEALGQNLHKFLVPERYHEAHRKAFHGFQRTGQGDAVGQTLELHAIRKDNVEITVSLSLSAVQKNGEWGAVGILRDITAQKQAEEELRRVNAEIDSVNRRLEEALLAAHQHAVEVEVAKERIEFSAAEMEYQARHDILTGLPNRLLFSEELDQIISSSGAKDRQCAVLFLDLDKFKLVNDTMGHKAGDALLVQTAARLSSCLREDDILARMGGDEFTILLKDIKSLDDPAVIAQRLLEQVSMPYEINGNKLVIGVSIGGSIFPDNATDAVGLMKTADTAMYKAKELGRNNCQFFSDEISQESNARVEIANDLRLALDRGELKVYYQPIIDLKTMGIAGAEALLRWDHSEKGMMSPGLFIPVAEETGLIIEIGRMVTDTAFKHCKIWQEMGYPDFEMSVNVSPAQLGEIGIISEIHGALADTGLKPECVKLEVTETVLAKNDNDEVDILSILRSLGLVVCLDDFGIGYSSLSRLNSLPIGHMKIDGYFIKNIAHNRKDRAMTESIIVMAHNLGIKVTAEWIEDEEQMAVIKSLDCDYAQGYLFSPALPAEKFSGFLRKWENRNQTIDAA